MGFIGIIKIIPILLQHYLFAYSKRNFKIPTRAFKSIKQSYYKADKIVGLIVEAPNLMNNWFEF